MYSLAGYAEMIADEVRLRAYTEALRSAIEPQSTVLDVGTGTGIFALIACQLGARKVTAIEPSSLIQVARELARDNGWADRIELIQEVSTRVQLDERADVLISDLRGVLPLCGRHLPSISDARRRLLAPGARIIAERDDVWVAVVEAPVLYRSVTSPWDEKPYGISMEAARRMAVHRPRKARVRPEQLLTEPRCWATLDYTTVESPHCKAEARATARRAGTGHGLIMWFDAVLAENIGFTNAPGAPELIYGQMFFPWTHPVGILSGDEVVIAIEARLTGGDYVWCWGCEIRGPGGLKASFKQSTFQAEPLSAETLRKRAASYRPRRTETGEIDLFVLSSMNGRTRLEDIARELKERFPSRFSTRQEALDHVARLALSHST